MPELDGLGLGKQGKIIKDINRREFILLISLLIPTILLGIYPNVILETLHASVTTLLYSL